jgi:2-methylisocitrate lyase-like PEP mutase family enzyme
MKICEAHSGLSALLVDKSTYDGIWISSLTHAAIKGLPDNECVPLKERVDLVSEVNRISDKPIIVDVDTFGQIEHVPYYTHAFSRAGAWAIILEDKKGTKQNSLLEVAKHEMEDVDVFAEKIRLAKANTKNMKIFARLESLIAKRSKYDALIRAEAYINAGADGIMVHSKAKVEAPEVLEVANELAEKYPDTWLIAVPTTYTLPEGHPFDIVIDANQVLRASLRAMQDQISGQNPELVSVQDIFDLVGK